MSSRLFVGSLVALVSIAPVHGQSPPTIIAYSGGAAPGTPSGVTYGNNFTIFPAVAGSGTYAYFSDLSGTGVDSTNNSGVWVGSAAAPTLLLRSGDTVPGTGGATVNGYSTSSTDIGFQSTPSINSSGTVIVYTELGGSGVTSSNNKAIVFGSSSANLQVLARTGQIAPGAGTAVFTNLYADNFGVINDAGQMVFAADLSGPSASNNGIWVGTSAANLQLLVRKGQQAPGTAAGITFDSFGGAGMGPRENASGTVIFKTLLVNAPTGSDSALYTATPGNIQLIALDGTQAPGLPTGVTYGGFTPFDSPRLADNGRIAFGSTLSGTGVTSANNFAFFSGQPGSIQLVARQGDAAAGFGSGVTYKSLTDFSMSQASNGKVAFYGTVTGTGITTTNNQAIWVGDAGNLSLLARTGDQAPGTAAGVKFSSVGSALGLGPVVNANGVVMFLGSVTNGANFNGLWAGTLGNLTLLLRTGETINVNPTGTPLNLTVSDIDYMAAYQTNSGQAALTDANVWTAYVLFTTGQSAIVTGVVPVPEPATGFAWALGVFVAANVRRVVKRKRQTD